MGSVGRRLALLALFVTAALAWPASSWAADGKLDGTTMVYTAANGESNSAVVRLVNRSGTDYYEVFDAGAVITAQTPCLDQSQGAPNANTMQCPVNLVQSMSASLGDGNDSISVETPLPTSIGAGGGADTMTGGPAADYLRGGQGDDTVTGGGGNDQLIGDDPKDPANPATLLGGNDSLDGGAGDDSVDGEAGADTLTGGDGNDVLNGSEGNDRLLADGGQDDLNGGDGVDVADYSARTGPQFLSLDGVRNDGEGARVDDIGVDVENIAGSQGSDQISGSDQPNQLDGNGGDDSIASGAGADVITGGDGNDSENGGDGNDSLSGDGGDDSVSGDAGDDGLNGGAGNDALSGGDGADTESGGDGNDAIAGGAGADTMQGDAGNDSLDGGTGPDIFAGGDGSDTGDYRSRANAVAVTLDGNPGDGELAEGDNVQADVENVLGGSGADTFIGNPSANTLDGGPGEDYSDGGAGSDTLVGGDAGDVLRTRGSNEPDTVTCGPGPDFVVAKPADTIAADCDRADRGVNQKPKRRDSAVVAPAAGTLQMSPAGIVRRVPLQDKVVLPLRSIVDTVTGAVKVQSAPTARKIETVRLEDGAFDITQSRSKVAITQFALQAGDFSVCPTTAGRRASAAAGRKASTRTVRVLWANGKGKFRTKGRYATATIRGTNWETIDRCDGTLIKVRKGAVTVRDLVKKKSVVVKAGDSYLAKR
jgi:Ca2+-binding RTX toxin-like protein